MGTSYASPKEEAFYRRNNRRVWVTLTVILGIVLGHRPLLKAAAGLVPISWEINFADLFEKYTDPNSSRDTAITQTIQAIGDRLLATTPEQPYHFHFDIVRSRIKNAYAVPGGHVVIYSALIDELQTSDELAGVMAHEIQHVLNRHSLQELFYNFGFLAVLQSVGGNPSGLHRLLAQFSGLQFSRAEESEADNKGMRMLAEAHISPEGMAHVFERWAKKRGHTMAVEDVLSTHPSDEQRVARLHAQLKTMPAIGNQPLNIDWNEFKKRCRRETQLAPAGA